MSVPFIHWSPELYVTELNLPFLKKNGVKVSVLRLDLIDPRISGNKWFKLRLLLEQAAIVGAQGVISLGGAHSNHLHALAAAGQRFGFSTVGLIRGHPCDTPTVRDLTEMGMELHWLGFERFRQRHQPDFWQPWHARYPRFACINEGGHSLLGAQGCAVLVEKVRQLLPTYDAWWLGVGTGTTLAGLVLGEGGEKPVYGALAVPAGYGVEESLQQIFAQAGSPHQGYRLHQAARKGFGKADSELLAFIKEVTEYSGLPLEPVYTGKALLALKEHIEQGNLAQGTHMVFVHTGGLQGMRASVRPLIRD